MAAPARRRARSYRPALAATHAHDSRARAIAWRSPSARADEVLAIIDYEQILVQPESVDEALDHELFGLVVDSSRGRDRPRNQSWLANSCQIHERNLSQVVFSRLAQRFHSQPRFANATRTRQREQPGRPKKSLNVVQFTLAPNKAGDTGC